MKIKLMTALVVVLCFFGAWLTAAVAQDTDTPEARLAAAHELLVASQIAQTFDEAAAVAVDQQVKLNPAIRPLRNVMLAFFSKYMSWDSMKDDMAAIYVAEFTAAELREMTKFYETPVGKKAALKLPKLMAKGGELGAARVQENMGELQRMIAEEQKRLAEEGK